MNDDAQSQANDGKPAPVAAEPQAIPLAEFLESTAPSQERVCDGAVRIHRGPNGVSRYLETPELQLHCSSRTCNGVRVFRSEDVPNLTDAADKFKYLYVRYICSNCQEQLKVYSLAIKVVAPTAKWLEPLSTHARCYKFGERPTFGPTTPARLLRMIQPDRDLFLKGRRCENQGLGIGAFGYYRRVVERQKDLILDTVADAAERLNADPSIAATLRAAKKLVQFTAALDTVKDAIPQALRIDGHNPLTLLHSALSKGLHADSDEECLQRAHDIRLVLTELSERLASALKDEAELKAAIARLTAP